MSKMRTGIFGGSFNPVHNGHINLVEKIASENHLDKVIVMPTRISPFKSDSKDYVADSNDRIEMCKLAFKKLSFVEISRYEVDRDEISYTIGTVEYLKNQYPDDELFLIIGSDMLLSFSKWKDYKSILNICTVITASRENDDKTALKKTAEDLSKYGRIIITDIEPVVISSTMIRSKIKNKEDISCLMPESVVKYILTNNLY